MGPTVSSDVIEAIVNIDHPDPFEVLGQHPITVGDIPGWVVRAFQPESREVFLIDEDTGRELRMLRNHDMGFFELPFPGRTTPLNYSLKVVDYDGNTRVFKDSYAYLPSLGDLDLHLFLEGKNYRIFETLGSHVIEHQGVMGVRFAVWAPAARAVSLIGSFNNWDRRRHPMRRLGGSGVWEIFVPGLEPGVLYKYKIKTLQGLLVDKTDPYAFRTESAPRTGSLVHKMGSYKWGDGDWMAKRPKKDHIHNPMAIYEVHIGSWLREPWDSEDDPNFREVAHRLVSYVKEMGYTHIELLPVTEHPFGGSWGYQTTGYYAPSSRWGAPEDLMYLIDLCHRSEIGVLLDWVPGHFPKDISALGRFDGTALFEHLDPRQGEHPDWGTFIFNYGRSEVRNFLIGSALFWLEHYHIDGIRIDAVSSMLYLDFGRRPGQWIPNVKGGRENLEAVEFVQELNLVINERHPGVFTAAEESTSWPGVTAPVEEGGLGFTFKWNLGWMNDVLAYLSMDPLYRGHHHKKLTFGIWYAFNERFILPLSHDEVVHLKGSLLNKMPGDPWKKFANLRLLLAYQMAHPGKQLLFMGGDLGQWTEWNHDVGLNWGLLSDSKHNGINKFTKDLNRLYQNTPALYTYDFESRGFEWVEFQDEARSVIAFLRKGADDGQEVLIVFNFTPVVRYDYRLGVEREGTYRELLNSDASTYGGSNVGNAGSVKTTPQPHAGKPNTLSLTLPPLGCLILEAEAPKAEVIEAPKAKPAPKAKAKPAPKARAKRAPRSKAAPKAKPAPKARAKRAPRSQAAPKAKPAPDSKKA